MVNMVHTDTDQVSLPCCIFGSADLKHFLLIQSFPCHELLSFNKFLIMLITVTDLIYKPGLGVFHIVIYLVAHKQQMLESRERVKKYPANQL